jgi:CheY-like chemotaxis protein
MALQPAGGEICRSGFVGREPSRAHRCATQRGRIAPENEVGLMTKILLVDDSKFLRLATERALARAGYEVSTAKDGEHALELAREQGPDLILLDMLLPKMTGPDVLRALKKDPATAGIAVVVFTGLSKKNAAHLQQDGAYAFLEKSELELDKGCETFLAALAEIVRKLKLEAPHPLGAAK